MDERIELLTSKQAGEILGIHVRTVQRLTKQGKIRGIRIGKLFKYKRQDIEEYLLSGTDFSKEPIRRPGDFIERRAFPRINCSIPCHAEVIIPQEKEIIAESRILNISEGGIFIKKGSREDLFNNIRIGDPINIRFGLEENSRLETGGRVLRVGGNGAAVKFRNISCETRNAIKRYIG